MLPNLFFTSKTFSMLVELTIKDIVLIHYIYAHFDNGLNVITGETGAGKSLLLDALGLIAGARGDGGLVRSGQSQGHIVAVFSIPPDHPCYTCLEAHNIHCITDEDIILRRVQYADGKSRAYINDVSVSIAILKQVANHLIEIHGQNDVRLLAEVSTHRLLLDQFADVKKDVLALEKNWHNWKKSQEILNNHNTLLEITKNDIELLDKTLEELDVLMPQKGEEEELGEKRRYMMNAKKVAKALNEALLHLQGNTPLTSALSQAEKAIYRFSEDYDDIKKALENIDKIHIEMEETISHLRKVNQSLDYNEEDLSFVEERLFALRGLARKHSITVEELPELHQHIIHKKNTFAEGEIYLKKYQKEENIAKELYCNNALQLRQKREEAIFELNKHINDNLHPLKLSSAIFEAQLIPLELDQAQPQGLDFICFHASLNPGTPLLPIHKIASGGEMSRITLVMRSVMQQHKHAPVMIFDEIDTGVGGATAEAVGKKLRSLGRKGQIISITHSPQVAAQATTHFYIEKSLDKETEPSMAITNLRKLSMDMREEEISRMLSGENISPEARAAARKLMEQDLQ